MELPRGREPRDLVTAPGGRVRLVLAYGEDAGLVRERAAACVTAVAGDLRDPFRVVELTGRQIQDDPALLLDEAAQLAFGGGRRAVWVKEAGDRAGSAAIAAFLDALPGEALVVVEAGELRKGSSLRAAAEGSDAAIAAACWHDDPDRLARVVQEVVRSFGQTIAPEAEAYAVRRMGADRAASRAELEKLCLFVGPGRRIELEDAEACLADTAEAEIEAAVAAAFDGEVAALEVALQRCFAGGESPVGLLRVALRQAQRLHLAAGHVAGGMPAAQAVRALRPPPFPREATQLARRVGRWPLARLTAALAALNDAEAACKTTGMPDRTICARALADIAESARRGR